MKDIILSIILGGLGIFLGLIGMLIRTAVKYFIKTFRK